MSHLLKGEYDLHITDYCNLHCKGCVVLDYQNMGTPTNERATLDDVKQVVSNLKRLDLRLEKLKLMGGEPTLHKDLDKIIDYLQSSNIADKLYIITNGLNFTNDVVRSIYKLDGVMISVYPITDKCDGERNIEAILKPTEIHHRFRDKLDLRFWYETHFECYGEPMHGGLEYTSQLNWDRCRKKNFCRVINIDGLYRCTVTYSEKKDIIGWEDKDDIIEYMEQQSVPLSHCEDCPQPVKTVKWDSNNLPIDIKAFDRGIELIKNCNVF